MPVQVWWNDGGPSAGASSALYIHQCGTENCESGHSFGPAVRDHFLIHCIFRGHGVFRQGKSRYPLHAGQCFLICPGVATVYAADQDDPWEYGWAGFNGADAGRLLRMCGLSVERPVADIADIARMESCVRTMCGRFAEGGNSCASTASLYEFFDLIQQGRPAAGCGGSSAQRAMEFINMNFSYAITVQDIAHYVGLERSQLFRVMKKATGMSPQACLLEYRLERARQLLQTSELTVTEVLYSCGFGDPCHFSRQFRRRYGLSPSAYRGNRAKEGI